MHLLKYAEGGEMTGKGLISCALRGDGGHQACESRRLSHNREELGKGRAGGKEVGTKF